MARNRLRGFVRPPARTMIWIGSPVANINVAASASVLLAVNSAAIDALRPFTIVRTRLVISVASDQQAASEFVQAVIGDIVVKSDATAIGITAVPTPITSPEAEWFTYTGLMAQMRFTTGVGFRNVDHQYQVDSKAMRKVGINEDIATVIENRSAFGLNIGQEGRILLKLH